MQINDAVHLQRKVQSRIKKPSWFMLICEKISKANQWDPSNGDMFVTIDVICGLLYLQSTWA